MLFVLGMAVVVLVAALIFAGPLFGGFARSLAESNPGLLRLPFVGGLVGSQLEDELDTPAGRNDTPIAFSVEPGADTGDVAEALVELGLLEERLPFDYLAIQEGLQSELTAGTYALDQTMSPREIVERLLEAPDPVERQVAVELRGGLRLEQVTAYLLTLQLETDIEEFYGLVTEPPTALVEDYPFLAARPEGASLEGFLAGGVYRVPPDIAPEDLVRLFLDQWASEMGGAITEQAAADGEAFYAVLALASLVEREAALDEERPLIAGVYANRLNPARNSTQLMEADPTVFYGYDTGQLRQMDLAEWPQYAFWTPPPIALRDIELPPDLEGFHTYRHQGPIPGPICTPTRASVEAALDPDTETGYLFFVARTDGSRSHVFARTFAEHLRNVDEQQNAGPPASGPTESAAPESAEPTPDAT